MQTLETDLVRGVLESANGSEITVSIPGTDYRIRFAQGGPTAVHPGKRVKGRVHAKALRMHRANAGGGFIEPVIGQPRIVQGVVRGVDPAANRLLLDVVVPMWIEPFDGQQATDFATGELVNFYMQSGAIFTPVA
ncbi:MAG: hypothetical protein ACO32J_05205 [Phycisphaerales bacterium]|jgi:hypothetical protein